MGSVTDLRQRPAAPSRAVGALLCSAPLWAWFGVAEFVRPWGSPTQHDEARGYDVVLEPSAYWISVGPGSIALLLTAAGVATLVGGTPTGSARWARRLAVAAGVLGLLSLIGVVTMFDPVATAGRLLGFVLLGSSCTLAASTRRHRGGGSAAPIWLAALACLTLLLLPLWPLVYALELLPPAGAAACFVLVGLGCIGLAVAPGRAPSTGDPTPITGRRDPSPS